TTIFLRYGTHCPSTKVPRVVSALAILDEITSILSLWAVNAEAVIFNPLNIIDYLPELPFGVFGIFRLSVLPRHYNKFDWWPVQPSLYPHLHYCRCCYNLYFVF